MSKSHTRALVLSGGGFVGGAWMLGLIDGLHAGGVDLAEADVVVGTSAGARTGAQLATGRLSQSVEMFRNGEAPWVDAPVGLDRFVAASMRIVAETADEQEAARRIANLAPLGSRLVSEIERGRVIAVHVPSRAWPDQRLVITAVDAESGRRVAFDARTGVALHDALAASSALPGIYPLVAIDGRRYADGGVHSLYNADLAAGHDVVIVLSPMPLNKYLQSKLDAEIAALGAATVRVVVADQASLTAIGPNALSPETGRAALLAGAAQAAREIDALRSVWIATAVAAAKGAGT